MKRKDKKQQQNKPKTFNDIYNSSNRYSMEMEHVRFSYDDHLADYMKRNGRAGSERVRSMNNSISMDEAHQESKITATANAPKTNTNSNKTSSHFNESNGWRKVSGWGQEFKEGMTKNWNDKRVNGMLNSIGGYLGSRFAKWSYGKIVAASAAGALTTGALTVGLYSGRISTPENSKKQKDG